MATNPPPCVIVLGMHRSGTSLLTGSLEAAGLYLGEINNASPFNRKGNKENEAIRSLNDALLAKSGAAWNAPPQGQLQWDRSDRERGKALIRPYQDANRPWGFKDPRTLWTVEGWLRLLPDARPIAVFRHPSLVVRSLVSRTGDLAVDEGQAVNLWCTYNRELLRLHREHRFPLLHFSSDATFRDRFLPQLAAFTRSIGLHGTPHGFFDEALVHHTEPSGIATAEARRIFSRLTEISHADTFPGEPDTGSDRSSAARAAVSDPSAVGESVFRGRRRGLRHAGEILKRVVVVGERMLRRRRGG